MHPGLATFARRLATRVAGAAAWTGVAAVALAVTGGPREVAMPQTSHVSLSGDVADLRPGVPTPLTVSVRNGSAAPARVTAVRVTVTPDGPARCGGYLTVSSFAGVLDVPPNGVRDVVLTAQLAAAMPPECRTVTWRLDYAAS